MMDDWLEIARRESGITSGSRARALTLIVTSYNPTAHSIKGIIQPHGVATGWIPIGITHAGPNFGHVVGPKAGDPMKLDGDQFSIEFENADSNTPIARHRLSSNADTPPTVQTGEVAIVSQFNHNILMKKDGSFTVNTNDKDVAGQNKNANPLLAHSATSVDNNKKTINHQTLLDPVKKTLTHLSTDGTNTHSTVFDLSKNSLTHSSVMGASAQTPADPVAPSLPKGLPNLPGIPGLSGGSLNFQHIFDLAGSKLTHIGTKGGLNIQHIFDMVGGKMTHQASNGGVTHSHTFDTVANTLTHLTQQGGQSHSMVLDAVRGILHNTTAAHSRTAATTITDTSGSNHTINTGNHNINAITNISKLLKTASIAQLTNYIH